MAKGHNYDVGADRLPMLDGAPSVLHARWLHQVRIQQVNDLTQSFRIVLQIDVTSNISGPREDSCTELLSGWSRTSFLTFEL